MKRKAMLSPLVVGAVCLGAAFASNNSTAADSGEKPRVFVSDSQSWSIGSHSGGGGGAFASRTAGGARPQTAEIIKTLGERCPQVVVNNIQEKADYIVVLDHEGGKGALSHKNKVAVFARVSGDSIVSKSTVSLGGSVQNACEAIQKDWAEHGGAMREAVAAANPKPAPAAPVQVVAAAPVAAADPPLDVAPVGKLSVASVPDGADIEVDGSFVGNTPSDLQLPEGEHAVAVKKAGFKDWERKLKVNSGSNVHLKAELDKGANP